ADAVVHRRLVQVHERVGVEPVTARPVAALDDHHVGGRVVDERVDEAHADRPGADDEVVGIERRRHEGAPYWACGVSCGPRRTPTRGPTRRASPWRESRYRMAVEGRTRS